MEIDQRNDGTSVSLNNTSGFAVDRWKANALGGVGTGTATVQKVNDAPPGLFNSLKYTVTNAKVPTAGNIFTIAQLIEGHNITDLTYGNAAAKTVTLSFWVKSSLTGTFAGSLQNINGTPTYRSYVFTYTISAANSWQNITITAPGDTGQAPVSDNTLGYQVNFDLGTGSTYQTTSLNSWVTGNFVRSTTSVTLITTASATFQVTGIQLEAGTVATPFERRDVGLELNLCQRYFNLNGNLRISNYSSSGVISGNMFYPCQMRVNPTWTQVTAGTSSNVISITFLNASVRTIGWDLTLTSVPGMAAYNDYVYSANAELS